MLLTLACSGKDAPDLSWLLHKRPNRLQAFDLPYGKAFVFFPEYTETRSVVSLLLEINQEALNDLCKNKEGEFQFVNPRQFLSSSLLSGAIGKVFSSAIKGICADKPELVNKEYDLELELTNFSCRLKPEYVARIFKPLGYAIAFDNISSDFPREKLIVGNLRLKGKTNLKDLLSQLYILIPVFDRYLHFWIDEPQLQRFIRLTAGWLESHPEKRFILTEYFWPAADFKSRVLERFNAIPGLSSNEKAQPLKIQRHEAIEATLAIHGAKTIIDLGCGEGSLIFYLLEQKKYAKIAGTDISAKNIESAKKRIAGRPSRACREDDLFVSSLTYPDKRLRGYDAAVLSEVIEHFEINRMNTVMKNILGAAKPQIFIMTTPNRAYNNQFSGLADGAMRHPDHRYEFTEEEFTNFCRKNASAFGYEVELEPIGEISPEFGAPTLMGVFKKCA